MKVGVISDTHDFLDPKVPELFKEVDHILHAGDVGMPLILLELEQIAPVTAVLGNTDMDLRLRTTETLELAGRQFLIHHIVNPTAPSDTLRRRIAQIRADVVVFGHTHKPFQETVSETLFFNPGYAGKPRFALDRSIAILHCGQGDIIPEYLPL